MRITSLILCLPLFFPLAAILQAQTWESLEQNFPVDEAVETITDVIFVRGGSGWLASASVAQPRDHLYKTTDGGGSWSLQVEFWDLGAAGRLFALDSLNCWALGGEGGIAVTSDGGIRWDTSRVGPWTGFAYRTLHFFNAREGIAFAGYAWLTSDGGRTWNAGDTALFLYNLEADFATRSTGWVVGDINQLVIDAGLLAKTTDGGQSWRYQAGYPFTPIMYGMGLLDSLNGFAVGNNSSFDSGYILSTTDGGENWQWQQLLGSGEFYDVGFLDKSIGWITGRGTIWRSTDGGASWDIQLTAAYTDLLKIIIQRDEKVAYIFGSKEGGPTVTHVLLRADLRTVSVDDTPGEVMPEVFSLMQNYPNPFNAQTVIEYATGRSSSVQVKVFNILGEEVKALIDQYQSPGRYRLVWDGKNNSGKELPAGVYICRYTSGSWSESRKPVLVK